MSHDLPPSPDCRIAGRMSMWTHDLLCERALKWLHGTRRCEPVFNNIASCAEIPDAIGWSSCHAWIGSTVIECKTSMGDFYADKKKYLHWQHPDRRCGYPYERLNKKEAAEMGFDLVNLPRMGNYRFFMCTDGLISQATIAEHAPDHGLLYCKGNSVRVIIQAPRRSRDFTDYDAEIRYLRFAIINNKKRYPYQCEPQQEILIGEARP